MAINLLTEYNNAGGGADSGGTWRMFGYRPGTSGAFSTPVNLTVDSVNADYTVLEIVGSNDNPEISLWGEGVGDYAFTYEGGTAPCNDNSFVIFRVASCVANFYSGAEVPEGFIQAIYAGGSPVVTGNYDTSDSADLASLESALQAWVTSNGGGTVTVDSPEAPLYRGRYYIQINGTTQTFNHVEIDYYTLTTDIAFRQDTQSCDYAATGLTTNSGTDQLIRNLSIDDRNILSTSYDLNDSGDRSALQTAIQNYLTSAGYTYAAVNVTTTSITVTNTDGLISVVAVYKGSAPLSPTEFEGFTNTNCS